MQLEEKLEKVDFELSLNLQNIYNMSNILDCIVIGKLFKFY